MDYASKIKALNLILPEPAKPVGSYRPVIYSSNTAYLSGQISKSSLGIITGKVGKDVTIDQGREAARVAAINVISLIQHDVTFARFKKFLRITGYVQTAPDFYDISKITDAASDLFLEIFGENGLHCRSSVGMHTLPLNAAVEIEATLEIRP